MNNDKNTNYNKFGVLLTCSLNGVFSVKSVKKYIDIISAMGYNVLELVIDDNFKIEGEEYFGYLRGGYTKDEMKEMDAYALSHGVELIPCIQTLGHLGNLTKIPEYFDIVDIDDILMVGEDKTYRLIEKMFKTLSECFTSRNINIGLDEAYKLGRGRYLDKHGYKDRNELMLEHLNRVVGIAQKYGYTIHMWSDMFFCLGGTNVEYSRNIHISDEVKKKVPEKTELYFWDYYTMDKQVYKDLFEAHKEFDREVWYAGGACCWAGFAPLNKMSMNATKVALSQTKECGIKNVLITLWADNGNECSYFSVLPALYAIRQYGEGNFDDDKIKSGFKKLFGYEFDDFMQLDLPNKSHFNSDLLRLENPPKTLLYNDCFVGTRDYVYKEDGMIPYGEYAKTLEDTAKRMGEYSYLFDNMAKLCRCLELKADLGIRTREAYKAKDKEGLKKLVCDYKETVSRIEEFRKAFRKVWMTDNKPYGWEIHEIRLSGLKGRISDCADRIEEYLRGETDSIPELDETILKFTNCTLQSGTYKSLVSVCDL